jgi:hypothetical protein
MQHTRKLIGPGLLLALCAVMTAPASAQELITNGGFETGSLSGWTTADQAGSSGGFFARPDGMQFDPFHSTVGPASGSYYAVSDQAFSDQRGNGSHALLQTFTVAAPASSVILSFDMFVDNYNFDGSAATPSTLDYTVVPNQQARVDILSSGAGAFDTGAGDLTNFYEGADSVTDPNIDNPHLYTHYSFDITSLVGSGGAFQLRFAAANNQDNLYQGVDNVSILETPAVPEASTLVSFGLPVFGLVALLLHSRRRRRQQLSVNA